MRKTIILLAVVAFVALAVAGKIFTQNTLHVARRTAKAAGLSVEIEATDKIKLKASWFPAGNPGRCVIVLHGISDSRASSAGFAPMFLYQGYSVLAPDSRAHGESGGDVVTYGLLEKSDILAWTRWMRSHGCSRLYGLGESLGGAILIQAAAAEDVFEAIVTESAYADLKSAAEHRLWRMFGLPQPLAQLAAVNGKWYARVVYGLHLDDASPLDAIRRLGTPVLLIHGLADNQTPPDHSRRLAAANPRITRVWLVPEAAHCGAYAAAPEEFQRQVLAWFGDH